MITASGLIQLGFTPDVDFRVDNNGSGAKIVFWGSQSPQPSEAEIEVASAEWSLAYTQKKEQKTLDKQNAHDKLVALGLTDAEIEAITS